jgi:glycerol-1-phosphate dehydrogenase [NAD(P)+]
MFVLLTGSARLPILTLVKQEKAISTGIEEAIGTQVNLCATGILDSLPDSLAQAFGDKGYIVITDATIWKAVSPYFNVFLRSKPDTVVHILPADPAPYASDLLVASIRALLETAGRIPLAVGSGTINDVVKRAAFECGLRYACVPTAPSVDGFTAYGAAITVQGFKVTLKCPAPLVVIADEEILRQAPSTMISAGYADLLAKLPAGADWLLAEAMGIESVDPIAWNMVQPFARGLLGKGGAIAARDAGTIAELYKGLVASGLAMQKYRDSRPASGAEHQLSHTWEMSHLEKDGSPVSHGFKVAIGSLISTALASALFGADGSLRRALERRNFAPADDLLETRKRLAGKLLQGSPYYDKTLEMVAQKTRSAAELEARAARAKAIWDRLSAQYAMQIPAFDRLRADLLAAGCPTEPADIGLSRDACVSSLKIASLIRDRYTILDFISDFGILDEAAEAAFSTSWFSRYKS